MNIYLIAALGHKRAIGVQNQLGWNLPEDLAYFKQLTQSHTILMGRKTFESIGRALPNRENIVLSRNINTSLSSTYTPNLHFAESISESLEIAQSLATKTLFVIGGAEIYTQFWSLAQRLYLTFVDISLPEADAFFPDWGQDWACVQRIPKQGYAFTIWERLAAG